MTPGKLVYHDAKHSYWLGGKRVKSASKVAQIAADSFTIEQWKERMVAIGMTIDPTLKERVAVDLENKEAIQDVAEEAKNVAKANTRAQRGTQRHRVFELGLLGEQSKFITDQQKDDWKVLERTLDRYQLEPIVDRVEQFVAWPDNGVVGRYDAYLYAHALGMPVLVDLKGGENAVKYPHSTAVQLWLYRNAPHTSKTIVRNGDKSEVTEWTVHPEYADPDHAYVIYCDDHHDVGELWKIDLNAARSGGELALGIVDWRKSYNYGKDIASQVAAPVAAVTAGSSPAEQPVTAAGEDPAAVDRKTTLRSRYDLLNDEQKAPSPSSRVESQAVGRASPATNSEMSNRTARVGDADSRSDGSVVADPSADRRAEIIRRYDLLNDEQKADHTARKQAIDTNDLDAVERLLDEVCPIASVHVEPVPRKVFGRYGVWRIPRPPPDEGQDVDDATIAALQREFERLSDEAKFWIASLTAQGRKAGVDWRPNARPTVRRYELARGIVKLAQLEPPWNRDDIRPEITRGLLGRATQREEVEQDSLPLGAALGTLDAVEAARFAQLVDDYVSTGSAA